MDTHTEHIALSNRKIDRTFRQTVDAVAVFVDIHGHLPRGSSDNEEERRLAKFLANQRTARNRNSAHARDATRIAYLDTMIPAWESTTKHHHLMSIQAVRDFVARHQRLPSVKAEDDGEASLARRLRRLRALRQHGELDQSTLNYFEQLLPGCLEYARWHSTASEISQFFAAYDRWPSPDADHRDEALLGKFLEHHRRELESGTSSSRSVERFLDLVAPGWSG